MVTDLKPYTGARLLDETVEGLSQRAPAIVAAAASEMRGIRLGLRFNDGTEAMLIERHSRLLVTQGMPESPDVAVAFDDRAMNLVFDLERRPVDEVLPESLDVRGPRAKVLAVWRAFTLLAQRAAGLRWVQQLWRTYREQSPQLWGQLTTGANEAISSGREPVGWHALDYLARRRPEDAPESLVGDTTVTRPRVLWDGHHSTSWWDEVLVHDADLMETMAVCRQRSAKVMRKLIPDREPQDELYTPMRDYPARQGKGLRPTLTIAGCAAFGGRPDDAVRAAAALELFHNGFLVHDDIADESTHRRGKQTMHATHGVGLAVNIGDGLNLLAIDAVLTNLETLGLARTLGLIEEIMHMCRETIEGQAIELGWIHNNHVPTEDADYFHMSTKKTGWYTCMSPCRLGALCAGVTDPTVLDRFNEAFRLIGIAFQIQDDVLNLVGEEALYGKEPLGDLLEGKRTVMLIHLFRSANAEQRARILDILRKDRLEKTQQDAEELLAAMREHGSIDYAIELADVLASDGIAHFENDLDVVQENEGKAVLRQIAHYVTTRPL
jgi:geranylgeranyl diphosphate synthase type II